MCFLAAYMTPTELSFEKRRVLLDNLISDNSAMRAFLERRTLTDIPHIDKKCAILFFDGDTTHSLKYVVHPESRHMLDASLSALVQRGLSSQMQVQCIPGVQQLEKADFYEGVTGLLGRFGYLEGFNLSHPLPDFTEYPEDVFRLYQDLEGTLHQMHARKVLHRDVKPGNIVYTDFRLHLIDFSLAAGPSEDFKDRSRGVFLGTVGYASYDHLGSRDFLGLAASFARSLFADSYMDPIEVEEFEKETAQRFAQKYGTLFSEYFRYLMQRPIEYDYELFEEEQFQSDLARGRHPLDLSEDSSVSGFP